MKADVVYLVKGLLPHKKLDVILLGELTTEDDAVFIGERKGKWDVLTLPMEEFKKFHIGSLWGRAPYNPVVSAGIILVTPKAKFTNEALDQLERILALDTRGKSTVQIHAEITRLANDELPKGHPLKAVPKSYPDRGTAIAAFTAIRQAILSSTTKESSMAKAKKDGAAVETKKPTAAEKKTAEKAAKEVKAKEAADTKAAAAAEKAKAKEAAAADKKKGGATDEKKPSEKAAAKNAKILSGNYVLNGKALTVKTPEELRLHEGSARYKLMEFMFANAPKLKNGVPVEKLVALLGDETAYAITSMSKTNYEFIKQTGV